MIRRHGEAVRPGVRYRARPGVYAILPRDGAVLVTLEREPWPELQLPGGGVEPGEQPLAALHREVREETGWRIAGPRRLGAYRRFTFMPDYGIWAEKICHVYLARPVLPLGPPSEPHHEGVWLDVATALDALNVAGDRAFLRSSLSTPSTHWQS